jgi:hypothetical protein
VWRNSASHGDGNLDHGGPCKQSAALSSRSTFAACHMLIFVHDLQEAQAAAGGDAATEETSLPAPTGPVSHSDALAHLSLREKKAAGEEVTAEEAGEGAEEEEEVVEALMFQKKMTWGLGGAAVL